MSLHYLVKCGCSKFLPNTGFLTIRLLRFGVKVIRAYCRDNFVAQRPLPDTRRLFGDDFLCFNSKAPRYISTRHCRFPETRESCEKSVVVYIYISACVRVWGTFRARILTNLNRSVMTTNNSAKINHIQFTVC